VAGVVPAREAFALPTLARTASAVGLELARSSAAALRGGPAATRRALELALRPVAGMARDPAGAAAWARGVAQAARDAAASRGA
jgi:hypothetical protein